MSEAFACFRFLSENTPAWLQTLQSLELKIQDRQRDISRIPVPSHKLKKTGSNESIRPKPECQGAQIDIFSAPQAHDVAQAPNNQYVVTRKRRTASLLSRESGPSKYRTRSMIIVYYDSEIQETFEQLVRNIGSGRNLIRKARMAARMEAMTNGSAAALMGGSRNGYAPSVAMFRSAQGPGPRADPLADSGSRGDDGFGLTDSALEKAQSFCELGAHQFLRDGDCDEEIAGARTNFEEIVRQSEKELARLKMEDEQRRRDREERRSILTGTGTEILNGDSFIEADDCNEEEDDFDEPVLNFPRTRLMAQT